MAWRTLTAMVLTASLPVLGCSCDSGKKLLRESGERWVLVGHYVNPRKSGPPSENWVATVSVPDGTMTRLVRVPLTTPDGKTVDFPSVAYSQIKKLLICVHDDVRDGNHWDDVWRYDLATGRSQWIAKGRWNDTRGFIWSPDGSKFAFVASTRGSPAAVVMQYDVNADRVDDVAGDAFGNFDDDRSVQSGDSCVRLRRPVYSEDGNWLYYISMDQHVMRVDLRTKVRERLPFPNSFAVLTVKDKHLIYVRELTKGKAYGFQIVKVNLDAPDDTASQQIYASTGWLGWNFMSPSRRFILFEAYVGYDSDVRLLDVEKGTTCEASGLLGDGGLDPHSTVFADSVAGPAGGSP